MNPTLHLEPSTPVTSPPPAPNKLPAQLWPEADAQCVAAILAGNRERFSELVERHQPIVRAVVRAQVRDPHQAEDACQDVFIKAFESLNTLRDGRLFQAWLLQIARHHAGHAARSAGQRIDRQRLSGIEARPAPEPAPTASGSVFAKVEELPEPYRQTVLLKYAKNMSCKEIAELEGVAVGTITSRLTRALATLRSGIAPQEME